MGQIDHVLIEHLGEHSQFGRFDIIIVKIQPVYFCRSRPLLSFWNGQHQHGFMNAFLRVVAIGSEAIKDRIEASPRADIGEDIVIDRVNKLGIAHLVDFGSETFAPKGALSIRCSLASIRNGTNGRCVRFIFHPFRQRSANPIAQLDVSMIKLAFKVMGGFVKNATRTVACGDLDPAQSETLIDIA